MPVYKYIRTVALYFTVLCLLYQTVLAADVSSGYDKKGALIVNIRYNSSSLPGIGVQIYQVADVVVENSNVVITDGNLIYTLGEDFKDLGFTDCDLQDMSASNNHAMSFVFNDYLLQNNVKRNLVFTDSGGTAQFDDLSAGLYLVTQGISKTPPEGSPSESMNYTMQSFLVPIPYLINDELIYNVTANPKGEAKAAMPVSAAMPMSTLMPAKAPTPESTPKPTQMRKAASTGGPGTTPGPTSKPTATLIAGRMISTVAMPLLANNVLP